MHAAQDINPTNTRFPGNHSGLVAKRMLPKGEPLLAYVDKARQLSKDTIEEFGKHFSVKQREEPGQFTIKVELDPKMHVDKYEFTYNPKGVERLKKAGEERKDDKKEEKCVK